MGETTADPGHHPGWHSSCHHWGCAGRYQGWPHCGEICRVCGTDSPRIFHSWPCSTWSAWGQSAS